MSGISYNIVRSARRRTASIVIHPDNRIDVRAPSHLSDSHIDAWVASKQPWIEKKLHFNTHSRRQHQPKTFRQGERFTLLGCNYALSVEPSTRRQVILNGYQLVCRSPLPDHREALRKQITAWYRQYAARYLQQRVEHYAQLTGLTPTLTGIKNYRTRWGSCHIDGRIYFNWRIIMAPPHIADYVVVHEMCHLQHHNHSPAFWQLVASILPDYREAKKWFKLNGLSLDL